MKIICILIWDNLKNSLRTKKAIIFLALYLLVFWLILSLFFSFHASWDEQINRQGISSFQKTLMSTFVTDTFENASENSPMLQFMMNVPPVNVVLFIVSLIGTPLLLFIMNYDKISQEVYDGTIRYLLFRVSRLKIFLAKFLSSLIECSTITLLALVLGVALASARFESVHFIVSMSYGIRYWFISLFFLMVFLAFSLMTSAIFKKPFTSLIVCFVFYAFMPFLPTLVPYISPFDGAYFNGLFFNNSFRLLFSLLIYLFFTGILFGTGYYIFKKEDL